MGETAMNDMQPTTIRLEDYVPTTFAVAHVDLMVVLHPTRTIIESVLHVAPRNHGPLILNGEGLELVSIAIDGKALAPDQFRYINDLLTIFTVPNVPFELAITQACNPQANTALSGLYLTNGVYCTQMEAEGFRRFAFMYDRPDVMATYSVRIEGLKSLPVLLSNGNPGAIGEIPGSDLHFAEWHDPHPKPTYLFALVAGDLASVHDTFNTMAGNTVALGIYVEKGKEDRCVWAMESLKASMNWEEKRFGRAYDLDVFNIVAVSDFNMGAMENKGLNIFNDKYVLARPDTATDADYINIERIIAHEYFHNWTGNRITCRDWFQLCLKEGLTVFRDQEFTSDLRSRSVKRIEDVITLRTRQFPEDQGPLSHPVRPSSYIEINNFYTATVYEKGAELCRMMHTLMGKAAFRRAMDIYFDRHDGDAATVEDFLACMSEASGRDLTQFKRWYAQAGTPIVTVQSRYDAKARVLSLDLRQSTPVAPGLDGKAPLHIPLLIGLLDGKGHDLPLHLEGTGTLNMPLIELTEESQTFRFGDLPYEPTVSINRGFTAPVMIETFATEADRLFLMAHDSDSFSRWEAGRSLATDLIVDRYHGREIRTFGFADALAKSLASPALDDAFKSLMLKFPSEQEIAARLARDVDAEHVRTARDAVMQEIARQIKATLLAVLDRTEERGSYQPDQSGTSRRALRYAALALLARGDDATALAIACNDFEAAHNMTAETGAIASVLHLENSRVSAMLDTYFTQHRSDALLLDKWFLFEGSRPWKNAAKHVSNLLTHADFKLTTPNRVYALLGGFTGNQAGFHAADGAGYVLLADNIIALNSINPQVAARMATSFRSWRQFDAMRRGHAETQMRRILDAPALTRDVYEIISRTLGD
jgi:aminopeptidase N